MTLITRIFFAELAKACSNLPRSYETLNAFFSKVRIELGISFLLDAFTYVGTLLGASVWNFARTGGDWWAPVYLLGIRVNVEPIQEIGPKVGCGHWVLFRETVHYTHYVHFNVAKAC